MRKRIVVCICFLAIWISLFLMMIDTYFRPTDHVDDQDDDVCQWQDENVTAPIIDHDANIPVVPEWITEYNRFAMNTTNMAASDRYLVYECHSICGGIGDRLKGIVTMYYVALQTKRRFLIDSTLPRPLQEALAPYQVPWNMSIYATEAVWCIDKIKSCAIKDPSTFETHRVARFRVNQLYFDDALFARAGLHNLQSKEQKSAMLFRWAFNSLFQPSVALSRRIDAIKSQFLQTVNAPYVAVHIRTGNGGTWNDPLRHSDSDESLQTFLDCAHKFQRSIQQTHNTSVKPVILVTSDSEQAKQRLKAKDESVRTANTHLFHVDRSDTSSQQDTRQGFLDAFAEFFLLKEATCIVRSDSGFSKIPSYFSSCAALYSECNATDPSLNNVRKL